MCDTRAQHLKDDSLRQSQIQLATVSPMIPFVRSTWDEKDILATDYKETKYGRYPSFSPLSQHLPIYGENVQVYCSVDPKIGQGVTDFFFQEYPSFPHEEVPVYYEMDHHQLKDEELLNIYNGLDLTVADSWAPERETREQANSLVWMEQRQNRIIASKCYVYSWKAGKERHSENHASGGSTPSTFVQRRLNHGRMYEPVAWKRYHEYFTSFGEDVKVMPYGVVVNISNRWLSCSPDAQLLSLNKVGIRECKCPYEQRDSDLMDVA